MPPKKGEGGGTEDAGARRGTGGGIPFRNQYGFADPHRGVKGTLRDSGAATNTDTNISALI